MTDTARHTCPDWGNGLSHLKGCGHEFEQEPDHEGWVDCPACGLAFNAEQAQREQQTCKSSDAK